jgi:DNA-binding CsgD family transcriptional regulator
MAEGGPCEAIPESQRACLRLVARGHQTKEIARALGLAPNTVDTYLRAAIRTLGVTTRFEAARRFAEFETAPHAPSQHLRYQPESFASAPIPDMPGPLPDAGAGPLPSVVRENLGDVAWLPRTRQGPLARLGDWLGGPWNDLTTAQRIAWMVAAAFAIALIAFLFFAAIESIQTTLLVLANQD